MIQDLEFENKYFLITGGSKGIGRSICLNLIKRNANIIFTYRKKDKRIYINKYLDKKPIAENIPNKIQSIILFRLILLQKK